MPGNRYLARLLDHFRTRGDEPFCRLIDTEGEFGLTWSALEHSARRCVAAYRAAGLAPGDLVLIFLRHGPAAYGAFFGAMLGGFVPSFMPPASPRQNPRLFWSSHRALLDRVQPAAIVADRAIFADMAAAGLALGGARAIAIDDMADVLGDFMPPPERAIALLQHSSGTTGLKKGVALSYGAVLAQIDNYAAAIALTADDVIVSWLPLYHDMGLIACAAMPAFAGVPVVQIDTFAWLARPALLFESIGAHGGTLVWLPNFAFEHLARTAGRHAANFDLSRVRAFIDCSEPCRPGTFDRFRAAFAASGVRAGQLQCCYAMAETVFAATQTQLGAPPRRVRVDAARLGRGDTIELAARSGTELLETGVPVPGVEVAIYDERRLLLPDGTIGEIGIRAPFLFSGYNRDPARTAERLSRGTYFTRDLGFLWEGHLFVLGRADDLIILNGRNLYAHDIEAAIAGIAGLHPGRSVAIGLFDEAMGSETLILICERDRTAARDEEGIVAELVETVASIFDVTPRRVHLVAEGWLAKTTSGKVARQDNRARFLAEAGRDADAS